MVQQYVEVNFNWVRGNHPVTVLVPSAGGRRPKTAKGLWPKGGLSSADPSGTLLA